MTGSSNNPYLSKSDTPARSQALQVFDQALEKDEVVRSETTESQTSRKRGIKITGTKITDEPIIRAIEERKAKKLEKEANKGTKPRGRPKGSKNKPKTVAPIDLEAENAISE